MPLKLAPLVSPEGNAVSSRGEGGSDVGWKGGGEEGRVRKDTTRVKVGGEAGGGGEGEEEGEGRLGVRG